MRISDDRYNRDRLRFDLAFRMMRHAARTGTISAWTGLSADRIRKLYRSYMLHQPAGSAPRRRGKSPNQIGWFLQTAAISFEATTLSCLFRMTGLLPKDPTDPPSTHVRKISGVTPERAEIFCQAYEAYTALHIQPRLSFEHGYFLLERLLNKDRLKLSRCGRCGRLYLADAARSAVADCGCGKQRLGWPKRGRLLTPLSSTAAISPTLPQSA